jgi:hypothetical protein
MTTVEVANQLVALCKQGKNLECIETMYADDIVAIEAGAPPGQERETRGKQGILGKSKWFRENNEIHSASVSGPWPHDDRFIVTFHYDVTRKGESKRTTIDEAALYTVKDGKIVREEFFYTAG